MCWSKIIFLDPLPSIVWTTRLYRKLTQASSMRVLLDMDKLDHTATELATMSWSKRMFSTPVVDTVLIGRREFGLMHITGERDGPPVKVGVAVTDLTTGLYTSNSVMAALLGRMKTGRGQHIDVALSDCQVATLANIASSCLISGEKDSGRWGTSHRSSTCTDHFPEPN